MKERERLIAEKEGGYKVYTYKRPPKKEKDMSETKVDILKELSHDSGVLTAETAGFAVQMEQLGRAWERISEKAEELEGSIDAHLEECDDPWDTAEDDDEDEDEGNTLADYDLWALYRSTLNIKESWDAELQENVPLIKTDEAGQYVPVKRHVHQHEMTDLERVVLNLWLYNEDLVEASQGLSMATMQEDLREDCVKDDEGEDHPSQYDRHGALKVA